jgi:solute carrier family 39 (zinc transporter), member 1/2/3
MIHSFVIGLTLSIVSTQFGTFTQLLLVGQIQQLDIRISPASLVTAIMFHQLFEGLSLGIRIASLPPSREGGGFERFRFLEPTLSFLFAVTPPIGILVGLLSFSEGPDYGE